MASLDAVFRILDRASPELRDIRREAERTDRALLRAGASANAVGNDRAMRSYSNAQRGLRGVRGEVDRNNRSMSLFRSRWLLMAGAIVGAAPLITRAAGVLGQLATSLLSAAGGLGAVGAAGVAAAVAGFGSVALVAKTAGTEIKAADQALNSYTQAVEVYGVRSTQAASAARKLNAAIDKAPAGTMRLLTGVKGLEKAWQQATRAGQGYLIGTAAYAVDAARRALPTVAPEINLNVRAATGAGRGVIDRMLSGEGIGIFRQLSQLFRQTVTPAADAVTNLLMALGHFAVDAGPQFRGLLDDFDRWTRRLSLATTDTQYMDYLIRSMVSNLRDWIHLGGSVIHFFGALVRSAHGGGVEVSKIGDAFDHWTAWIRENPVKVTRFFNQSSALAAGLARGLVFIVRMFGSLTGSLDPLYRSLGGILHDIGGPLVSLLNTIATTISLIGAGLGHMGGPLTIALKMVNGVLTAVNWLIQHVPFLGAAIGAAFAVVGIAKAVGWITSFGTRLLVSVQRMFGLKRNTDAATLSVERLTVAVEQLGLAERTIPGVFPMGPGGAMGRGGGILAGGVRAGAPLAEEEAATAAMRGAYLPPVGGVTRGGVYLPPGAAYRIESEIKATTTTGLRAGLREAFRGGGARAIPAALATGIGVGFRGLFRGGLRGGAGGIGARARGGGGLAALLAAGLLTSLPSRYFPGGRTTRDVLGGATAGAGLGYILGPEGAAAGAIGGAEIAGLSHLPVSRGTKGGILGASLGAGLLTTLGPVGPVAGFFAGKFGLGRFFGGGGSRDRQMDAFQRQATGAGARMSLDQILRREGGADPRTAAQIAAQIRTYNHFIGLLVGDTTKQAQAARQALQQRRSLLRQVLPGVRVQERHAQFMQAAGLEERLGAAYGVVQQRQGPQAGMDFVLREALKRWKTLGPAGKQELSRALVTWGDEMRRANPKLTAQFDAIKQSAIGKFQEVHGRLHLINGQIYRGTESEWKRISSAISDPVERARELVTQRLTDIQKKLVGSLEAMGYKPAEARRIVQSAERKGAMPTYAKLPGSVNRTRQELGPGVIVVGPRVGDKNVVVGPQAVAPKAHGGRVVGDTRDLRDTVRMGGNTVAPGELVVNRHTEARVDRTLRQHGMALGREVARETRPQSFPMKPRRGELVRREPTDSGIMPGLARGGRARRAAGNPYALAVAKANEIAGVGFPYTWGGGHNPSGSPSASVGLSPAGHWYPGIGYDCSGSVSAVLMSAGLLSSPQGSGYFSGWGLAGKGAITTYSNAEHIFMSLGGKPWGTYGEHGPGWIPYMPNTGPFTARHAPVAGRAAAPVAATGSPTANAVARPLPNAAAGAPVPVTQLPMSPTTTLQVSPFGTGMAGQGVGQGLDPLAAFPGASGMLGLPGMLVDVTGLLVGGAVAQRIGAILAGEQTGQAVTFAAAQGVAQGVEQGLAQATARPTPGVRRARGGAPRGTNQQIGRQMMLAGGHMGSVSWPAWGASEWPSLRTLWTGESSWDEKAMNPSSGATGIPQSLPGSKMASAGPDWATNAATQMGWGLSYIADRYGSPSAALSAWEARSPHWYREGGRFVARRPMVIGVGDTEEEVRITPTRNRGAGRASFARATRGGMRVEVRIDRIDYHGPGDIRETVRDEIRDALQDVTDEVRSMGLVPEEDLVS